MVGGCYRIAVKVNANNTKVGGVHFHSKNHRMPQLFRAAIESVFPFLLTLPNVIQFSFFQFPVFFISVYHPVPKGIIKRSCNINFFFPQFYLIDFLRDKFFKRGKKKEKIIFKQRKILSNYDIRMIIINQDNMRKEE
jgi:hypothetical protein